MRYALLIAMLSCAAWSDSEREKLIDRWLKPMIGSSQACTDVAGNWGPPIRRETIEGRDYWTYTRESRRQNERVTLVFNGCTLAKYSASVWH